MVCKLWLCKLPLALQYWPFYALSLSAKHILWLKDNTLLRKQIYYSNSVIGVMDTLYNLSCPLLMYRKEESSIKWKVIFHDSWQFYGPTSWLINETEKYHHAIIVLYILTLVDCHIHICMDKSLFSMSKCTHILEILFLFHKYFNLDT